jgi:hypothetical protein
MSSYWDTREFIQIHQNLENNHYYDKDVPTILENSEFFREKSQQYTLKTIRWLSMKGLDLNMLKPPVGSTLEKPDEKHHIMYYRLMEVLKLFQTERDSLYIKTIWEDFLWLLFRYWKHIFTSKIIIHRFYKQITASMISSEYSGIHLFWGQLFLLGLIITSIPALFVDFDTTVFGISKRTNLINDNDTLQEQSQSQSETQTETQEEINEDNLNEQETLQEFQSEQSRNQEENQRIPTDNTIQSVFNIDIESEHVSERLVKSYQNYQSIDLQLFIEKYDYLYTLLYDSWLEYQTIFRKTFLTNLCFCPKISDYLQSMIGLFWSSKFDCLHITYTRTQLETLREQLFGIKLMKEQCMYRGTELLSREQQRRQEQSTLEDNDEDDEQDELDEDIRRIIEEQSFHEH